MHGIRVQRERRLALVRHGRSSHVQRGWLSTASFRAWRQAYESAGIREAERVPSDIALLADRASLLLSSDAPRALESAKLLALKREVVATPLLRELELEGPDLGVLRLPLPGWAIAVGAQGLLQSVRRKFPSADDATRLDELTAWLDELAQQHALTLVVTHASLRMQLAKRLVRSGWQADIGRRSLRHWSAWRFIRSVI